MDPLCGDEGEEVQTEALDSLLEENGIDRVDVIKVDVEGAEELVLRGATRSLTRYRPVVIFEIQSGLRDPPWPRRAVRRICWKALWLCNSWCSVTAQTPTTPESRPTYFNIVAIPKRPAGEFSRSVHSLRGEPEARTSQEL